MTPAATPDPRAVAARAIYESTPGATFASVAAEVGARTAEASAWSRAAGGWTKAAAQPPALTERAHQLVDQFAEATTSAAPGRDPATVAAEAATAVVEDEVVRQRAGIIDRHRREWSIPRAIAMKAVADASKEGADQAAAFERAKLAKITSETLTLVQAGERAAYGIDKGGKLPPTILIERTE